MKKYLIIFTIVLIITNVVFADLNSDLIHSAKNGTLSEIELLIKKGADVNAKDGSWSTPLHSAVKGNNFEVVKLLISKGANVNAMTRHWYTTPLGYAVTQDNFEIVEFLVSNSADVNAQKSGTTQLHAAASREILK